MSNIRRYTGWTQEQVTKDAGRAAEMTGGSFLKLHLGANELRFLPSKIEGRGPIRQTRLHFVPAIPGTEKMFVIACAYTEFRQDCRVCAEMMRLQRTGNPADADAAHEMRPQYTAYANVLNREIPGSSPQTLKFKSMVYKELEEIRNNPRSGGDPFDSTANGFDVTITKTGDGLNTKYKCMPVRDCSPVAETDEETAEIIESTVDLDTLISADIPPELEQFWGASVHRAQAPAPRAQQATRAPAPRAQQAPPPRQPVGRVGAGLVAPREAVAQVTPADLDDDFLDQ